MSSYTRNYHPKGGVRRAEYRSLSNRNNFNKTYRNRYIYCAKSHNNRHGEPSQVTGFIKYNFEDMKPDGAPSMKRRRYTSSNWGDCRSYVPPGTYDNAFFTCNTVMPLPSRSNADASTSTSCKRDRSQLDDDEVVFMSRDEIERLSPSRKDGIDLLHENQLRYSYCNFLQNLGLRLELPQTTIATATVLCHRFFVRRSHACHDRFLIATAALFLAAKSEETARPLNNVLRASCEIYHKQNISYPSPILSVGWFEQYREQVIVAEQLILTTLNFEIEVQHPYGPLTAALDKLGLSHTDLLSLALNLISQGQTRAPAAVLGVGVRTPSYAIMSSILRYSYLQSVRESWNNFHRVGLFYYWLQSSLWLQFRADQIAAGAVHLAARTLKMDLSRYHNIWQEFQATPSVIKDVAHQLMELC